MNIQRMCILVLAAAMTGTTNAAAQASGTMSLMKSDTAAVISRHIYGHFSEHLGRCIYDGYWVGEHSAIPNKERIRTDIVEALRKIHIPNLRWPGGCFADEYHWRDGIGPRDTRPAMVNTNWGGVTEDNSFGTHEFLRLCEMLGCEPYITGNVGSGTVEEMSKWVEYVNFDGVSPMTKLRGENGHPSPFGVHFWGIGNENWGCGGQMTPEYYSSQYLRYSSFTKSYPNAHLNAIACGPYGDNYQWTETCMKAIGTKMWGMSLHYYTLPRGQWSDKGSATSFDEAEYFTTLKNTLHMDELITKHSAIMDTYDPGRKVALVVDEWGVWTDVEPGTNPGFLYQQNSLRDALVAASNLNIFNNHCDRVRMANLAQTVNVLQALVLTDKEKLVLTPTYSVFDLYQVHQDAQLIPLTLDAPSYTVSGQSIPAVNASASMDSTGTVHISLVNLNPHEAITLHTSLTNIRWKSVHGRLLTSPKFTDINTFDNPEYVHIVDFNGISREGDGVSVVLPPTSVVMLTLR